MLILIIQEMVCFTNAQTGNVVLMSQGIMAGEWKEAVRYMIPLLAFALGVFVTERIQYKHKYDEKSTGDREWYY